MLYLFILESIGTAELLLIGLVALIIFGPRKLPELARMLGKARNEFKKTTDDFKETWTREVDFENLDGQNNSDANETGNSIHRADSVMKNEIVAPQIKEISQADFQVTVPSEKVETAKATENNSSEKREWL